ncbi:unnamed protein product [Scytosiphon promiscuus]
MVTSAARAHEGLAVVTGAGWLTFYQLRSVECTCLYVCRESRRQVARRVRVALETPRTLWDAGGSVAKRSDVERNSGSAIDGLTVPERQRGAGSGGVHKFSWHSKPSEKGAGAAAVSVAARTGGVGPLAAACAPRSLPLHAGPAALPPPTHAPAKAPANEAKRGCLTRVPTVRVVSIIWQLPVTDLLSPEFAWPRGVKDLQFWAKFEDRLEDVTFPETLETLTFGYRFNRSLGPGCVRWPRGLKRLRLGAMWNRRLIGGRDSWPASLEVLHFGTGFNKPLQGKEGIGLPPSLREIHLGGVFDQPLEGVEWPPTLRKLTFSEYFNRSIEYVADGSGVSFPGGLQEMSFCGRFDQEIARVAWPEGLMSLTFGDKFNRPFASPGAGSSYASGAVGGSSARSGRTDAPSAPESRSFLLPSGLRVLVLGDDYDHPMSLGELPDSLTKLVIGKSFSFTPSVRWPAQLKRLELACRWGGGAEGGRSSSWLTLPSGLEYLDVGDHFNSPLDKIALPATLKVLVFGSAFDHPIDHPADRRADDIDFSGGNDRARGDADGPYPPPILPDGLEELRLGAAFNREIEGSRLPRQLKRLRFTVGSKFDRPVVGVAWPPTLEQLRFGNCFDQPLESGGSGNSASMLPATLRELSFGWAFSYSLQGVVLPPSLEWLSFCARYPMSHVQGLEWPPSLRGIFIGSFDFRCRRDLVKWPSQVLF